MDVEYQGVFFVLNKTLHCRSSFVFFRQLLHIVINSPSKQFSLISVDNRMKFKIKLRHTYTTSSSEKVMNNENGPLRNSQVLLKSFIIEHLSKYNVTISTIL